MDYQWTTTTFEMPGCHVVRNLGVVRGVTVRRFANSRLRDLKSFNAYSDWIFNNPHTHQDEMEWLKQQGPWSPPLADYLERHPESLLRGKPADPR